MGQTQSSGLDIGYFGASTGAAAALNAVAAFGTSIGAVVSRGGRPDLAMSAWLRSASSDLADRWRLDEVVLDLNREAYAQLNAEKYLAVVAERPICLRKRVPCKKWRVWQRNGSNVISAVIVASQHETKILGRKS